ncbi:hypothetical protein MSBRW_3091 [Methanosarcina barkeri str. Wiesmoor]|uniref:DUF11 domain-containing protein n=1 Tax=Methanosarcina barkeri str. Wiesmoor TaxID=1434109 RepID=A0A0E3QPC8_METBA|nr:hypothetical protein MSBRW_3091 [Methanosarcina barkeri str. Wiesmoor]
MYYTVTNTGTVTLTGITLADDLYPTEVAACNVGDLALGEAASCYIGPITAEVREHINGKCYGDVWRNRLYIQ